MAKSNQPNFTQEMLQEGFNHIDATMAQDDPEMGALIDSLVSKLSGPMAKRMGISVKALRELTMNVIRQRSRQMMAEEGQTRQRKMATVQQLGQAERAADLQLAGLKLKEKAFDRQIAMRYVGAALSAAGSFIGQGIASGLFEADPAISPDVDHEGYDDFDAQDMDINPYTGRPLTEHELKEGPVYQESTDAAQQQSISDYFDRSAKQRAAEDAQAAEAKQTADDATARSLKEAQELRGVRGTEPGYKTMDVRSSPEFEEAFHPATLEELGSLGPQEASGMRNKTDKDRFAGILNALRGSFA